MSYFGLIDVRMSASEKEQSVVKSVFFRLQLRDPQFFQNCGHFQYDIS